MREAGDLGVGRGGFGCGFMGLKGGDAQLSGCGAWCGLDPRDKPEDDGGGWRLVCNVEGGDMATAAGEAVAAQKMSVFSCGGKLRG